MNDTFLGNSCVSGWLYHLKEIKYNNPFIWHLILDDSDFIKVCKKFDHYISQQPLFIDEDLKMLVPLRGVKKPQELELYLKMFKNNDHKNIKSQDAFTEYYKAFKPEFTEK